MENLEADFQTVVYCLQVSPVRYAADSFYHLIKSDPMPPLANTVMLNHQHTKFIQDLPSINHFLIGAIGSLIATNIGDLVTEQRVA